MASEELQEVERIVDKRQNKKGETEYLVWWKGYGREDSTWEPEQQLVNCEECIHDFNRRPHREAEGGHLHQSQPDLPEQWPEADLQIHQQQLLQGSPQGPSGGQGARGQEQPAVYRQPEVPEEPRAGPGHLQEHGPGPVGQQDPRAQEPRQERDRAGRLSGREPREAGPRGARAGGHSGPGGGGRESGWGPTEPGGGAGADGEAALDTPDVAAGVRPVKAAMATGLAVNRKGTSRFMDALTANGTSPLQTLVTGVKAGKRKFIKDRRDQPFDKRLHFSVRQRESAYKYRDIVVRKQDGFTHILLSTKSSENNSLNPEVMKELQSVLSVAAADDSKLVLLSAMGSIFCCGLDCLYFHLAPNA